MTPTPEQVKQIREAVQAYAELSITAAQDWCAAALHTSRRAWQQWETVKGTSSHRSMHPAFWELLKIKTAHITHKS